MKRTIKTLIGIVMLVFLAACNPDIGDGQSGEAGDGSSLPLAANWLKGTT